MIQNASSSVHLAERLLEEIFLILFFTFRIHKKLPPLCLSGSEAARESYLFVLTFRPSKNHLDDIEVP